MKSEENSKKELKSMSDWAVRPLGAKAVAVAASNARYIFGFDCHYVPNIVGILENELAKLIPEYFFAVDDLPRDALGNSVVAQTQFTPPAITFNKETYKLLVDMDPFARFTGAHELGHILLHSGDRVLNRAPGALTKFNNKTFSAEWQANEFAANFLVPEHIAREFNSPQELAQNTMVSLRVAQIRMSSLNLWPPKSSKTRNDLAGNPFNF
jgi:hypothetical protein